MGHAQRPNILDRVRESRRRIRKRKHQCTCSMYSRLIKPEQSNSQPSCSLNSTATHEVDSWRAQSSEPCLPCNSIHHMHQRGKTRERAAANEAQHCVARKQKQPVLRRPQFTQCRCALAIQDTKRWDVLRRDVHGLLRRSGCVSMMMMIMMDRF